MQVMLEKLTGKLIISCQPVPGGPMDNEACVKGFALAAIEAGAAALRIESLPYVKAVRAATHAPIIGLIKHEVPGYEIYITPTLEMARQLAQAGADVVAFDATRRMRPDPLEKIVAAIHENGALAMADCADIEDAKAALAIGADCIGSTLSGYVSSATEPMLPDFDLVAAMADLGGFVIAEGRIRTPEQAAKALSLGANAVVVGSAITRTEHIVSWYKGAIDTASAQVRARA